MLDMVKQELLPARLQRRADQRRRPAGHHHVHQEGDDRRPRTASRRSGPRAKEPARRGGQRPAGHRRAARLLRRAGLPRQSQINWADQRRLAGLVVQAVRAGRGHQRGLSPQGHLRRQLAVRLPQTATTVRNEGAGRRPGNDYGAAINLITGHRGVGEHGVRRPDRVDPRRPGQDPRDGQRAGHPAVEEERRGPRPPPQQPAASSRSPASRWARPRSARSTWPTPTPPSPTAAGAPTCYMIEKVVDRSGETAVVLQAVRPSGRSTRTSPPTSSYALQQVVKTAPAHAQALGRPAAGKTGTATNADDEVSSSWFVGYTPQMATAVMYVRGKGNESSRLPRAVLRRDYPTQTWTAVMQRDPGRRAESRSSRRRRTSTATRPSTGHAPYTPPPPPTTRRRRRRSRPRSRRPARRRRRARPPTHAGAADHRAADQSEPPTILPAVQRRPVEPGRTRASQSAAPRRRARLS